MRSGSLRAFALIVLSALAPFAAEAGTVSISGRLTSFQSALTPFVPDGNGSVNGVALAVDPGLPSVQYDDGDTTLYPQSQIVSLGAGATSVQFEYTNGIGTVDTNPNQITFTAASPADVNLGDTFKVGTLTYTNGYWYPFASIGLVITTSSGDVALDGHSFLGRIVVKVSSPEPFDPADYIANADYFYLQGLGGPLTSLGSVRVYERAFQPPGNPGNTGSVDLYARIGSLIPTSFENPLGGVFLSPSLDPITTSVPEPGTFLLLTVGLAAIGARAQRRAR